MNQKSKKQQCVDDVNFVLTECARFQNILSTLKKGELEKRIPKEDLLATLPRADGQGIYICGREALKRINDLSRVAVSCSDAAKEIDPEKVRTALKRILVVRFIQEKKGIFTNEVERALAAAVKEAKAKRRDITHFIPCRLMYVKTPSSFKIGPVTFKESGLFSQNVQPHFQKYIEEAKGTDRAEYTETLLEKAKGYYEGFTWVAEVKVLNCDPVLSYERAYSAVTAAIDFMHLIFGAYHTRRMYVAGPKIAEDQRSQISLDSNGDLNISYSSAATSAVGFSEGWGTLFEREDAKPLLKGAALAIEPILNPAIEWPVAMRLIDAAAWFGQAVREESDATRAVKSVIAVERLIMTKKGDDTTKVFCERGAAFAYNFSNGRRFDEFHKELSVAYKLRSDLVHGSLSPFDLKVKEMCWRCVDIAERIILSGLSVFEAYSLLDKKKSNSDLAIGFEKMVEIAKDRSTTQ